MNTSLVAAQYRLQEWAEMIRECNARPTGQTVPEWCEAHGMTKATYYYRLKAVRKAFLNDPEIPMDNNGAERAIRGFCIGRKNWVMIDTIHGAQASAIIYSLVETAKANDLKIYEYLEYLLTEIPQHEDDKNLDFLDDLLPWSEKQPERCRKTNI